MKFKTIFLLFLLFSSCAIFNSDYRLDNDKISFLTSISKNPSIIDITVKNSKFYDSTHFESNLDLSEISDTLVYFSDRKLRIFINESIFLTYHYSQDDFILSEYNYIGLLFENSDIGIFATFKLHDNKWIIIRLKILNQFQMKQIILPTKK